MTLTVNAKAYNADSYQQNQIGYIGPLKTVSIKDDIVLKRTAPKATSVFSGVGRTTSKLTRSLTLTGALTTAGDAIVEINVSVPVGFTAADVDSLLNDMGSHLSSASFKTLVKAQQITY
jgi:hypothetical protein